MTCSSYLAVALWYLGYPRGSNEESERALELAEQGGHLFSRAFGYAMAALYRASRLEAEEALHCAVTAVKYASESQFPFIFGFGLIVRGWALAKLGRSKKASKLIRRGLSAMKETGAELGRPLFLSLLADTLEIEGDNTEALKAVEAGIQIASSNGDRMIEADLNRLKGRFLQNEKASRSEVAFYYRRAVEVAQGQEANLLELRALLGLARLEYSGQAKTGAKERLAEVYEAVGDGLDTLDLGKAREFLAG